MNFPIQRPISISQPFREWVVMAKSICEKPLEQWDKTIDRWVSLHGIHNIYYFRKKLKKDLWNECFTLRSILLRRQQIFFMFQQIKHINNDPIVISSLKRDW